MSKKWKWMLPCLIVMMLCSACGEKTTVKPENNQVENDQKPPKDEEQQVEKPQEEQPEQAPQEEKDPEQEVTVYGYDDQGTMIPRTVVIQGDLTKGLVAELKKEHAMSEDSDVLSAQVNVAEKTMELDMNEGFGKYIRSMGTFGESVSIECVVRTFAGAYGCTAVKLTENGAVLESGHAIYDSYLSY